MVMGDADVPTAEQHRGKSDFPTVEQLEKELSRVGHTWNLMWK